MMKLLNNWLINVLILMASFSLLSGCASQEPESETKVDLPALSVQLWSVKEELKQDFKGTLEALAAMGFEGVEFAGDFGEYSDDPKGLKEYLKSIGLKVSGAHVSFASLSAENFDKTVAFYKAFDCMALIVPYDERAWDPIGVLEVAKELNIISQKLSKHGMRTGFHNHQHEFGDYEGSTYWDYIARNTNAEVILQQDVGWTNFAGKDPVNYVRKYPGRTYTTHYKATLPEGVKDKLPIIGQDSIDWPSLIKANIEVGGTEWIVMEQEEYPNGLTPLQAVAESKIALDAYLSKFVRVN